jgi:hypothetical protein
MSPSDIVRARVDHFTMAGPGRVIVSLEGHPGRLSSESIAIEFVGDSANAVAAWLNFLANKGPSRLCVYSAWKALAASTANAHKQFHHNCEKTSATGGIQYVLDSGQQSAVEAPQTLKLASLR